MKVSKNAYYSWLKNKDVAKKASPLQFLKKRIKGVFEQSKEIYGSYRIQKILEKEGLNYSRSYIGFLMKEMGLKSILKRKFRVVKASKNKLPVADNLLNRNFTCFDIGTRWVSDITYIRVNDSWSYLTVIIDLADRKVVGWSLSNDMTTENTVMKAWLSARQNRVIRPDFMFHSDRGIQYTSGKVSGLFSFNRKVTQSMSRKGNCWDNAVAESFFKTIKCEWIYRFKYTSYEQLYSSIKVYICWYNTERIHSTLGYVTPLEKEMQLRSVNTKTA